MFRFKIKPPLGVRWLQTHWPKEIKLFTRGDREKSEKKNHYAWGREKKPAHMISQKAELVCDPAAQALFVPTTGRGLEGTYG